jgi:hypothetical protein
MLRHWIKKLRVSREWVRALDAASQHEFAKAFSHVETIERLQPYQTIRPTEFDVNFELLKAMLLWKLGRLEQGLNVIRKLAPILKAGSRAEHDYLRAYLSFLAHAVTAGMEPIAPDSELSSLLQFSPDHIRAGKVPKHIQQKFPIPDRSRWPAAWNNGSLN